MIQNVKELGAELHIEGLGNPRDLRVLDRREIKVHQSGSNDCVTSQVPQQIDTGGKSKTLVAVSGVKGLVRRLRINEALRLNVLIRISWINQGAASATCETVRDSQRLGVKLTHRVPFQSIQGPQRNSIARFEDCSYLPPLRDKAHGPTKCRGRWNFVQDTDHEVATHVEVRQPSDNS